MIMLISLILFFSLSAQAEVQNQTTDLGEVGNHQIAQAFEKYKSKKEICRIRSNYPRVILTGFGLFSGIDSNISGVVSQVLASTKFWPSQFNTKIKLPNTDQSLEAFYHLNESDLGARTAQRIISIDGRKIDICFLTIDVKWDLASAITIYQMHHFQPHFVLMTGRGESFASFEGGANNYATPYSGFHSNGEKDFENTPKQTYVLNPNDPGVKSTIPLTWNPFLARERSLDLLDSMGYESRAARYARDKNDYICNNIAFTVASAALNPPVINLAGNLISLEPKLRWQPKVGFFHYPQDAIAKKPELEIWARIILRQIKLVKE